MTETVKPARRRTKAEKVDHAMYAQRSTDRKRAAGLTRLSIWVPATEKTAFKNAADASVARFMGEMSRQTCGVCAKPLASRTAKPKPKPRRRLLDPRQMVLDLG
ncbi:hypothetical protein [Sulfitobacter sp.]|uniref:hypothetical protein n=1 Tax=Sulfitobacter sp. TaxID=1903071 RepID=UPI003567B6D2